MAEHWYDKTQTNKTANSAHNMTEQPYDKRNESKLSLNKASDSIKVASQYTNVLFHLTNVKKVESSWVLKYWRLLIICPYIVKAQTDLPIMLSIKYSVER